MFGKLLIAVILTAVVMQASSDRRRIETPREVKVSGSIQRVEQNKCDICNCVELTAVIRSDAGRLRVKLGPKQVFEERDFVLLPGDIVEVTGLRFRESGGEYILANEVRKGGETMVLRGKYGKPEWLEKHGHTCPVCGN